ncbi:MAG TPA: hypothetical protein VK140_16745 [Ktedonobacteraceae bacterium]|nr:hypothetical protein [Ktedonobacteraceae bacterium]
MNKQLLFFGAIIVAVISLAIGVYYAIPGYHHVATFGSHPPNDTQPSHVVLFLGITVVCVVAALITRPRSNAR